jgi:hypothetical protein
MTRRHLGRCSVFALAAAVAVLGFGAAPADAFVRTRVQKGEYAGTAIAWPRRCIPFHLNERGSDNAALGPIETAVRRSFAAWEQVDCSDTELTFQGLTNVELVGFTPNAKNINMVVFQEESWPHESKIIALTTVTYCSAPSGAPCDDAGRVLDADIEMNGVDFDFTVTPVPGLVRYDVQNTVTHEVGHFLGLDHTSVEDATMFAYAPAGERSKQSLADDDVAGLCDISPHVTPVPACEPFDVTGDYIVDDPWQGQTDDTASGGGGGDDGCAVSAARTPGATPLWGVVVLLAWGLGRRRPRRGA